MSESCSQELHVLERSDFPLTRSVSIYGQREAALQAEAEQQSVTGRLP